MQRHAVKIDLIVFFLTIVGRGWSSNLPSINGIYRYKNKRIAHEKIGQERS